jgi:hypothetical protein
MFPYASASNANIFNDLYESRIAMRMHALPQLKMCCRHRQVIPSGSICSLLHRSDFQTLFLVDHESNNTKNIACNLTGRASA